MTSASSGSANFCYRHPDRQSYILCQRCGRTICPQCQTQAPVGVQCPECIREGRASTPRTRPAILTSLTAGTAPVVTYSIIVLCVIVYLLQVLVPNGVVTNALAYNPVFTAVRPWTMLTSIFAHSPGSIFHIVFNMYSLFVIGPPLEQALGRARFLVLYLLSGFAGSVAVALLAPTTWVVGASGAIFGLLGAFFIISRKLGGNNIQLLIVIGLNLAIGFIVPGIAWQAHVGGLIVGGAVGFVYLRTRRANQRPQQILMIAGIFVLLVVVLVLRYTVFSLR